MKKSAGRLLSLITAAAAVFASFGAIPGQLSREGLFPAFNVPAAALGEHTHNGWAGISVLPETEGSYYLTADITINSTWNVPAGTTNLCLNGHSITSSDRFDIIEVGSNAVLNLYDESGNGGRITHAENQKGSGVYVRGTFNMYGGSISGNDVGNNIPISSHLGGGVNVNDGTFNMYGGDISGNTGCFGGGVYVYGGAFNLSGGRISGNTAVGGDEGLGGSNKSGAGGGVYLYSDTSNFTMTGGEISDNKTKNTIDDRGGGVNIKNGTLKLSGGEIKKNFSLYGGGVSVLGGTVEIDGCKIKNNTAYTYGGGVFIYDAAAVTMEGGEISENSSNTGGGIYLSNGKYTFTLNNGKISGNEAKTNAGGIYCFNDTFIMNGGEISDNRADTDNSGYCHGYGVYVRINKTFKMTGGFIRGHSAECGVYCEERNGNFGKFDFTGGVLNDLANNAGDFVKVTFEANGGSGTMPPRYIPKNKDFSVGVNEFGAPEGYALEGWSETPGGALVCADKGKLNLSADKTLYAKWKHTHSWDYTVNGASISASCPNPDCDMTDPIVLSLTAPAHTKYGDGKTAAGSITGYPASAPEGLAAAPTTISYFKSAGAGSLTPSGSVLSTAPTDAGNYVAQFTWGEKTASLAYTIAKADKAAPSGLGKSDETIKAKADGSLTGLNDTMEYKLASASAYTPVPAGKTAMTGLSAGKYKVRFKETANYNASPDAEVTIAEGSPLKVTFKNGTETFATKDCGYNQKVSAPSPAPQKTGYTFKEWQKDGAKFDFSAQITGNIELTAAWTINQYTVTWKDGDGKTLKTEQLPYGTVPAYTGATPTKTATAQYTYTFNNTWSPAIAAVSGNAEYTAQFGSAVNKYTVTWKDGDGKTLKTEQLPYGAVPAYGGATPTKTPTAQYTYTFNNTWSPAIAAVSGNAEYTAQFGYTVNKYTVTWKDGDGKTLKTEQLPYGTVPAYTGATPAKTSTAQYTYTFNNTWSPAIAAVTGNAEYTAQFGSAVNKYTVKFLNDDGTLLQSTETEYGTVPEYTGRTPEKAATAEFTYRFKGWDKEPAAVTGTADYTATFTAEKNKYTVKFVNDDGTVLQSSELEYGALPEYTGKIPEKAPAAGFTYTFDKWAPDITEVTGAATYIAVFKSQTASEETVTPDSIAVKAPSKTVYKVGEALNTAGMTITAAYSDGTKKDIPLSDKGVAISGFDSTKEGKCEVTVTYGGKSASFTVTIKSELSEVPISLNDEEYESITDLIKDLDAVLKNASAQEVFEIVITEDLTLNKPLKFRKSDATVVLTIKEGVVLKLLNTTITAKCNLGIEGDIRAAKVGKYISVKAEKNLTATGCTLGNITVKGRAELTDVTINGSLKLISKADKTYETTDRLVGVSVTKKITSNNSIIFENCPNIGAVSSKGNITIKGANTRGVSVASKAKKGASSAENLSLTKKLYVKNILDVNGTINVNGTVSAAGIGSENGAVLNIKALSVGKEGLTQGTKPISLTIVDRKGAAVVFKAGKAVVKKFKGAFDPSLLTLGGLTLTQKRGKLYLA